MPELNNYCQPRTVYECAVPMRMQPACRFYEKDENHATRCIHRNYTLDPATCECADAQRKS